MKSLFKYLFTAALITASAIPIIAMKGKPETEQTMIQKIDRFLAVSNILTSQTTGVQILKTQIVALQASSRTDKTAYMEKVYNTLPLLKNTVTNSSYTAEQMPPRVNLHTAEGKLIQPHTLGDLVPYIEAMERILDSYFTGKGIQPASAVTTSPAVPVRTTPVAPQQPAPTPKPQPAHAPAPKQVPAPTPKPQPAPAPTPVASPVAKPAPQIAPIPAPTPTSSAQPITVTGNKYGIEVENGSELPLRFRFVTNSGRTLFEGELPGRSFTESPTSGQYILSEQDFPVTVCSFDDTGATENFTFTFSLNAARKKAAETRAWFAGNPRVKFGDENQFAITVRDSTPNRRTVSHLIATIDALTYK